MVAARDQRVQQRLIGGVDAVEQDLLVVARVLDILPEGIRLIEERRRETIFLGQRSEGGTIRIRIFPKFRIKKFCKSKGVDDKSERIIDIVSSIRWDAYRSR